MKGSPIKRILAVFNFSDQTQEDYEIELNDARSLTLLLASDAQEYAGTKIYDKKTIKLKENRATLSLSPYSAVYYKIDPGKLS